MNDVSNWVMGEDFSMGVFSEIDIIQKDKQGIRTDRFNKSVLGSSAYEEAWRILRNRGFGRGESKQTAARLVAKYGSEAPDYACELSKEGNKMNATIDVKELLAQTITGLSITLQQELEAEDPGYEALVMYKSLLDNIVSYTALCGHAPAEINDWTNRTCVIDVEFFRKVLNDYEVDAGLRELGVDPQFLIQMLPEPETSSVQKLLATATGDIMNTPGGNISNNWEIPKVTIASILPCTTQDNTAGLDHCSAILSKVFVRLQYKFTGKTYEEANRIAEELIRSKSSEVLECMNVDGGIPYGIEDTITLRESIYWTAAYMSTGVAANLVLAYVGYEPTDKFLIDRPVIWNCLMTASNQGNTYPNYGLVNVGNGEPIPILATSLDILKVTMREG